MEVQRWRYGTLVRGRVDTSVSAMSVMVTVAGRNQVKSFELSCVTGELVGIILDNTRQGIQSFLPESNDDLH